MTTDGDRYAGHDPLGARGRTPTEGARAEGDFVAFAEAETEHSVPDRFEKQADRFPSRTAVGTASREFTYDALNRTANRIAHAILAVDAEGEQRVALLLEQSAPLLAASILGILKAGKIYVPIDPSYPPARTTYVLEDSQAALIVTGSSNLSLAHELAGNGRDVLNVDEISPQLCEENPGLRAGPDSIAYIIYTSGSTGQPKGVVHTHRNLLRYIRNYTNSWRIRPSDRLTLFFSPSFSQSLMDIFSALLKGAALHPYDVKQEGFADLATWLIGEGITVFDSVPTLYRHFLDNLTGEEEFPELRLIRLGGEPVSRELVARTRKQFPGRVLLNQLAATEASMIAQYSVDGETGIEGSTVPAGYPVDGVEILVIDDTGAEVGFGQVGEIVVKSRYLSSGYWRKPGLTQAAFRSNPHGGGKRLYHTGDLGRLRSDGCLEFLGRKDSRVKVRGHSIEVAEIEAALFDLGNAKEVAVTALELGQDDLRLVAYVVPRLGSLPSVSSLRTALARTLPDYMIPSTFVSLPALPMTPNGKLDRRALPKPDEKRPDLESAYEAPRTQVEEVLAGIWEEVLGLERVGVNDDFFELGGHSLLATRVVSRLRDAFGLELPLRSLFEAPTVAELGERIEMARRAEQDLSAPPLVSDPRDGQPPLSFAQQRMWLVDQLEPGTSTYNISEALRLDGRLNVAALERSLTELVRRHEALRTTFAVVEGNPVQVISPAMDTKLPVEDLTILSKAKREEEAKRLAREERQRPFDLERGPLWKAKLLRLDEEEHVLLLKRHHIVADAWSMGLIRRELTALYDAFSGGEPSPLAELPVQYADYALWQRRWLAGEVLEEQLGYWREQLAGLPALELPTDRPRPVIQTHRGAHRELELPESLAQALKDLSRQEGTTLFMVLLAAFQTLLARYTNQEDIAVGSPIAGRNRVETEGLVGFFVNTLVMRTDLSGGPTFKELLGRVREVALGAYAHQDLPFERLVEDLQPERDLSRTPLFQVFFNMQNVDDAPIELSGLTAERIVPSDDDSMFDLTLYVAERHEGLHFRLVYNADLFEQDTVRRMLGHFRTLLEGVAEDPDQHLSEVPLLGETERHRLLFEWNATATEYPRHRCVHELFEEQVERTPDAVAVAFEEQQLTYRELNRRANQLARSLRKSGVGPEALVGICVERSLEMVVGLLGILKAGGAYVPLDPAYPEERLSFMLEDARAPVLLTQERLVGGLPDEHEVAAICLDTGWEEIAKESGENPVGGARVEDLAYVIYTSGSTGKPKGVQISHGALTNFLCSMRWRPGLTGEDVLLAVTTLSFDIAALELFLPLTVGARVVLVSRETASDGDSLLKRLAGSGTTVMQATPATWRLLLEAGWEGSDRLKVLCGGEALPKQLADEVLQRSSSLWNMYGPTEATIWSTVHKLEPETDLAPGSGPVPIGRPIANTTAYVLDSHLRPVPIGVGGELYIGGEGLARGYLGRPELTAEKFVPDPFDGEPGARLYKTGDLARYRPDGSLEYLGRLDNQVKVRGFRIELGEIETLLDQHPAVRRAVVSAMEGALGDKQLVAYVVPGSQPRGLLMELKGYLQKKLPAHMVPSTFTLLDEVPLTPNGKVNRKALPTPDPSGLRAENAYAEPRTPVEERLVEIWEEVLGLERVGVNDDFFELGGHSLLATRVVSRTREIFQVKLPLRNLFEEPTIVGFAEKIEEARRGAQSSTAPPLVPAPRDGQPPLSFSQERMWLLDQLEPDTPTYNISNVMRLTGSLDAGVLERSLKEIVSRHEALRTTFAVVDGEPMQVISPTMNMTLPVEDLSSLAKDEREVEALQRAREEKLRPFDLQRGPLVRSKLVRLSEGEHLLVLTTHHIVSDGWSMGVFWRELGALYEAFSRGEPSPLAELPVQYADYALWQRRWLAGEVLEEQLGYWREQLAGLPALELPTDRPRPAVQTHRGARQTLVLSRSLTEALKGLARGEGVTLYMVLLGAFQALLARYSGQEDVAVGSPIAGRNQAETEGLVGFFVNTLVMRTDLSGDPTFKELLGRVREMALGAYDHQDLPFEKLVEELRPKRDLSRVPLSQVFFALQNVPREALKLPDLALERQNVEAGTVKFDLSLFMSEEEQGLEVRLAYNVDLFDDTTIERMLGCYQTLLEGVAEDPDQHLSEVPLLGETERHRLLFEWNATATEYPRHRCVHELFEEQVERTPDAVAVAFEEQQLTYRELNRRANQLARSLRKSGVGPEALVGICVERSLEMVVGLLGILKAGGAYVPLDPAYPEERLSFMLEDARAPVLLTQERLVGGLPDEHGAEVVRLDADWPGIAREAEENITRRVTADNLAYVIYTSGSTGRPKGTMIEHRALSGYVAAAIAAYETTASDRVLQFASLSFDASVEEIFPSLACGGTLVLRSDRMVDSMQRFVRECEERAISVLDLPTAFWHELVLAFESEGLALPPSVRLMIIGGEKALAERVAQWHAHTAQTARPARLMNTYGPTEATVVATLCELLPATSRDLVTRSEVPIGRPLGNTIIYILDGSLNPLPIGVPGELHVGGSGLARGYFNRPELTSERFIPNPFSDAPGARLYKTGDMARWRSDGNIEFLGRADDQVKIRGFRVEPAEVEAVLGRHPALRGTAVLARMDAPGDERLVAYVVSHRRPEPTVRELGDYLKERLPEYLVPSAFVTLDSLPLTPSGKVDRHALPAPDPSGLRAENAYAEPRTPVEERLVEIWEEVLGLERVGVNDDFFELGGHSLLATRVVSRVRGALGVELPLRYLFETPTAAGLAKSIEAVQGSAPSVATLSSYGLDQGRL